MTHNSQLSNQQSSPSSNWPALKLRDQKRLTELGITFEKYERFLETFVRNRWDWTTRALNGNWFSIRKRPLVHSDVIGHLEGRRLVGARASRIDGRPSTRFIVIDVDAHDADPNWRRLEILRSAFGPPLLFRSSKSNGRHAYYFLPESTPIEVPIDPRNPRSEGMLVVALAELGIAPKQGWIEVYPTGCIRDPGSKVFRCGNAVRLPFGDGSALIDPSDLSTLVTEDSLQSFHIVMDQLDADTLPTITLDQIARVGRPAPSPTAVIAETAVQSSTPGSSVDKTRRKRPAAKGRAAAANPGESPLDGEFEHGLTGGGQTNSALLAAAMQMATVCTTREELLDNVLAWFGANHNGLSGTLNRGGWESVRKKATDAVEWAWHRRTLGAVPTLSQREVHRIRALARHAIARPQMPVPSALRFKLELLMCEVSQRAKQWILRRVVEMRVGLLSRNPELHDDPDTLIHRLAEEIHATWPESAGGIYTVPMPWKLRARMPGISLKLMTFLFQELKYVGFVRLAKNYCTSTQSAALYELELDFSQQLPSSTSSMPWEALLYLMVPQAEHRSERTAHTARRIDAVGSEYVHERFGILEEQLVALLRASTCWTCADQLIEDARESTSEQDADSVAPLAGEAA